MMYFVQSLQTYSPKNRACKKLLDYVEKYKYVLIKDELSLDALKEELRIKVNEINSEHPKLKKIRFSADNINDGMHRINASIDNMGCPEYVFYMDVCRVRSIYQFSEEVAAAQEKTLDTVRKDTKAELLRAAAEEGRKHIGKEEGLIHGLAEEYTQAQDYESMKQDDEIYSAFVKAALEAPEERTRGRKM